MMMNNPPMINGDIPDISIDEEGTLATLISDIQSFLTAFGFTLDPDSDDPNSSLTLNVLIPSPVPDESPLLDFTGMLTDMPTMAEDSFTPPDDFAGVLTATVTVMDDEGAAVAQDFTITVNNINDAPVIPADALEDVTTDEDTAIVVTGTEVSDFIASLAENALDIDNPNADITATITVTDAGTPIGDTIVVDLGAATQDGFTFTPPADFNGTLTATVVLNDGELTSAPETFDINVTAVNDAPEVPDDFVTALEDLIDGPILEDSGSGAGNVFTIPASALMPLLDGLDENFFDVDNTNDEITAEITITDQDGNAIDGTDVAPITVDPMALADIAITLPENFDGTLTASIVLSDGELDSEAASFDVDFTPVNDAPVLPAGVFNDVTISGGETVTVSVADQEALLASASPIDVETADEDLTVTFTITDADDAEVFSTMIDLGDLDDISFTPENEVATLTASLIVADEEGLEAEATFDITVNPPPEIPDLFSFSDITIDEDESTVLPTISFAGILDGLPDFDLEGPNSGLTYSLVVTTTDGEDVTDTVFDGGNVFSSLDMEDLSFTPPQDFAGDLTVSVVVTDSQGGSDNTDFVITVNPFNDAPVIPADVLEDVTTDEDTPIVVSGTEVSDFIASLAENALDVDNPNAEITATITVTDEADEVIGAPIVVDLGAAMQDGFTFTPPADFNGTLTATVVLSDGELMSDEESFDINVTAVNDAPEIPAEFVTDLEDLIGPIEEDSGSGTAGNEFTILAADISDLLDGLDDNFFDVDNDNDEITAEITITDQDGNAIDDTDVAPITVDPMAVADITITLPENFDGTLTASIVVSDGDLDSEAASFDIDVTPVNDTPVLPGTAVADITVDEDTTITVAAAELSALFGDGSLDIEDTNADLTAVLTVVSIESDTETMVFESNIDLENLEDISFLPPQDFFGNLTANITVTDLGGESVSSSFEITVNGLNDDATPEDDLFDGTNEADDFNGLAGNDTINGLLGNDTLLGDADDDEVSGDEGNDVVGGGTGNDTLNGDQGFDALFGGLGDDVLNGGSQADNLFGGLGEDILNGGDGFDRLFGEFGDDLLNGGDQDDVLFGNANNDTLNGNLGEDTLNGGTGFDSLFGNEGNDELNGNANADNLIGGSGDDILNGGQGFDRLFGDNTNLSGDPSLGAAVIGNDLLNGGLDNDVLFGQQGNDTLNGDEGNDRIIGGSGFDVINGGTGNDQLTGNFNADTFVFEDDFGEDVITDFDQANLFERIDLSAVTNITDFDDLVANHLSEIGGNAVITDGENTIVLTGVSQDDLDIGDFVF